jgi:hypothetical protein
MTILVIGDSNSFGLELPDVPATVTTELGNEYFDNRVAQILPLAPSQLAWPELLGKLQNTPVVNLSLIGGSNDRIFRMAMTETVDQQYSLVICAWTAMPRFDLFYQGKDLPFTVNSLVLLKRMPWLNDYIKHHYDDNHQFDKQFAQVIALQNHFRTIGQKYLFINSCETWFYPGVFARLNKFENLIQVKNYPGFPHEHMLTWTEHIPVCPGGHMSVDGHKYVAKKIHDYLSGNNV